MILLVIFYQFLIGIICGLLGSYGGTEGTSLGWRRVGVPLVLVIVGLLALQNFGVLVFFLYSIGIGYGIPDSDYPSGLDSDGGSNIGYYWWDKFKKDENKANIATRTTVGVIKCIPFIAVPIITGSWLAYFLCSSLIVINRVVWGALIDNEGTFNMFGKKLLVEEADIYFGDGFFVTMMIMLSCGA